MLPDAGFAPLTFMSKRINVDGQKLLDVMIEHDITQEELFKVSQVSVRTIRRLCRPESGCVTSTMEKLVKGLNTLLRGRGYVGKKLTIEDFLKSKPIPDPIPPRPRNVVASESTAAVATLSDASDQDGEGEPVPAEVTRGSRSWLWRPLIVACLIGLLIVGKATLLPTSTQSGEGDADSSRIEADGVAEEASGRLAQASQRMRQGLEFLGWTEFAKAKESFRRAHEIRHELLGPNAKETLDALRQYATACSWLGEFDEAERLQTDLLRRLAGTPYQVLTYSVMADLAETLNDHGKATNNLEFVARDGLLRLEESSTTETLKSRHNAVFKSLSVDPETTQAEFERIMDDMKVAHGERHPNTIGTMMNLALFHLANGDADEADKTLMEANDLATKHLGPDHLWTALILSNLAVVRHGTKDELRELAEPLLESFRRLCERMPSDHPVLLSIGQCAAAVCWRLGKKDEGVRLMRQVVAGTDVRFGDEHPLTWQRRHWLAVHYKDANRTTEAIPILEHVIEYYESVGNEEAAKAVRTDLWATRIIDGAKRFGITGRSDDE